MADIRAFFSPHGGKSKINTSNNGANATPTREEKTKSNKKKPRLSTSPEIKKSKNKGSGREAKKSGAKRAIVISESDDDDDFVKKKQKKPKRSQTSDSDEDPIPQDIRKSATKTNKKKTGPSKTKKSTYFDESDEEDEEAPIKLPKSAEKTNKPTTKSNTKDAPQIQETPVKHMTSASDFFGSAPVQRSAQKKLSTKRKQPLEDTPEKKDSNPVSPSKTAAGVDSRPKDDEQPIKKRKEVKSPKKSPAKEKKTLAGKLSKAAAAYLSVPDTPPSGTTEKQEKPQPSASPIKTVKESPKKTPEKPKEKTEEEPPSLEKKKSSYRSFMQRDGPRSLGTREIPQGADNCFEGMTFVITGVLETIEREEAQHIIQRCGGKVTQAVSKKTAYVIVGRDPGLSKTSKAEKLGTKVINEDEFYELVKTTPGKKSSYDPSPEKPPSKKPKTSVSDSPLTKTSPAKIVNKSPLSSQGESSGSQKSVSDSPLTKTSSTKVVNGSPLSSQGEASGSQKSVSDSPLIKTSSTKVSNKSPLSSQGEASSSQTSVSSLASLNKAFKDSPSSSQKSLAASPATKTPSGSTVKGESLMWVDKYKPSTVKQIIGQQGEKSNMRKLMNWIKNWHINRTKKHPKTSFFQKDQDGAIFKAALLSGPPGVGKTTTSVLVCQELGYSYVEMNASDARNKKCLQEHVSELLSNKSIDAFVEGSKGSPKDSSKHVLIMDEVDGMAGNEDRGGMQELISLIKNTKIPIICMCNDRNSQKIRSLVNYCFDLRFQRPRVEQIKGAMMSIAFKEGLKIPPPAMDQIIIGANQDIRQVLHNLSMWTSTNKIMTYDQAKNDANKAHKDIKMGPFDAIRKLLSSAESSKLSLIDKSDLFFCDYSLMPLFVQQNYLDVRPSKGEGNINKILKLVSKTADSISDGDLVEKHIRSNGHWSLLPTQAMLSSVIPSHFISGVMGQRIEFPQWLGKNSKKGRLDRILQELQAHMRLRTSSGKACVNLDYVPHLRKALTEPLMDEANSKEGVSRVISLLDAYDLTREDWDSIMEAGQYEGHRDPMTKIPSKVKAAFTRAYNKDQHKKPYALKGAPAKSRGKNSNIDMGYEGAEDELEDEEEEESIENSAMIVKNKNSAATKGKGSKKQQEPKGKGKGKGKNARS